MTVANETVVVVGILTASRTTAVGVIENIVAAVHGIVTVIPSVAVAMTGHVVGVRAIAVMANAPMMIGRVVGVALILFTLDLPRLVLKSVVGQGIVNGSHGVTTHPVVVRVVTVLMNLVVAAVETVVQSTGVTGTGIVDLAQIAVIVGTLSDAVIPVAPEMIGTRAGTVTVGMTNAMIDELPARSERIPSGTQIPGTSKFRKLRLRCLMRLQRKARGLGSKTRAFFFIVRRGAP